MSIISEQSPERICELVFFLTRDRNPSTKGLLYVENGFLVVKFDHSQKSLKFSQATAFKSLSFTDDGIEINSPDTLKTTLHIYPDQNEQGRFQFYALESWVNANNIPDMPKRKYDFLQTFYSFGAKCGVIFQLAIPYLVYYAAFLLRDVFEQQFPDETSVFLTAWHSIVFSPLVATHYLIFAFPAILAVFFGRLQGLRWMTWLSFITVLLLAAAYWIPWPVYQSVLSMKPVVPNETSILAIPAYWLVTLPYMILLILPAFYYMIVMKRQ
ncbi:MAG: hypothetical protein FWC50_13515 [Planctomycetaceae bacterium]|nr:hypothetical protein [Planctomycetaceae bacterium]